MAVSNKGSSIPLLHKFGARLDEALPLLRYAVIKNLDVVGVSFHVGSQAESLEVWTDALSLVAGVISSAKKEGIELKVLNIGGGFPVRYSSAVPTIQNVCRVIKKTISDLKLSNLELWLEPGRYLVAESGVIGSKIRAIVDKPSSRWIYLDVGRFNCFTEIFESEDIRYPVLSSRDNPVSPISKRVKVVLTGPTCDSFDTLYTDVLINKDVKEGDNLYFSSAGAYTHVYGSSFNDFAGPTVVEKS